ncbi:hypothetical protein B0H13DRAFT_2668352 [Mycena leptocephala]|nr:hypothetical protein B0H13DRAFT_2668352 [Mycena leptocephala]
MSRSSAPPILPRFSDEVILEIFEHLTDAELLSLAGISKHIHDLALLTHLARYGFTETDVAANSFSRIPTSAFHAFRLARFITSASTLSVLFDHPSTTIDRDVAVLARLLDQLRPKSIDLEFGRRPKSKIGGWGDIEGLLFTLIASYRSRPTITVSPLTVSIVRPRKSALRGIGKLYARLRSVRSKTYVRTEPMIDEEEFREALIIFPLMRLGGVVPSVTICALDAPSSVGCLIVLRAGGISDLRIPPSLRLSPAEMSALFGNLKLPLLRTIDAQVDISDPALSAFFSRHPTIQSLRLRAPWFEKRPTSVAPLPSDALSRLEHVLGSAQLVAWVLASPHPFPYLAVATIELNGFPTAGVRDDYRAALRGLARRPATDTLALHLKSWAPWEPLDYAAASAPERAMEHLVDLRVTFRHPSRVPHSEDLAKWLRLFPALRKVSLFDHLPLEDTCIVLRAKFPQTTFTGYILKQ